MLETPAAPDLTGSYWATICIYMYDICHSACTHCTVLVAQKCPEEVIWKKIEIFTPDHIRSSLDLPDMQALSGGGSFVWRLVCNIFNINLI
jgi:hypothetical protein